MGWSHLHRTVRVDSPETDEEVLAFKHDWRSETELGPSITFAVVELTGRPPEEVGAGLRRSVDSDGLDCIFRPLADGIAREGGRLVLSVASCEVTVYSDGWVEVAYAPEPDGDRSARATESP